MPVAAERTQVCFTPSLESEQRRGIERVTLGSIAPLAHAHALARLAIGFFPRRHRDPFGPLRQGELRL
jgi:hypothetical protein